MDGGTSNVIFPSKIGSFCRSSKFVIEGEVEGAIEGAKEGAMDDVSEDETPDGKDSWALNVDAVVLRLNIRLIEKLLLMWGDVVG